MCEICNIEKGNMELLVGESVAVKIGKIELEPQHLSFGIYRNEKDKYEFVSAYYIDGGDPVVELKLPIDYCPYCGRRF